MTEKTREELEKELAELKDKKERDKIQKEINEMKTEGVRKFGRGVGGVVKSIGKGAFNFVEVITRPPKPTKKKKGETR